MKKLWLFVVPVLVALTLATTLPIAYTQDYTTWGLPEGAKARVGKGGVWAAQYSPDHKYLAAAGSIGIWLYDASTYEELSFLTGHTGIVTSGAFSPNGETLASGSEDYTIGLWDVQAGALQDTKTIETVHGGVTSLAFSPNGRLLASAGWGGTHIWYVETGELIADRSGSGGFDVAFSPDGKLLASESADGTVLLWGIRPEPKKMPADVNNDGVVNIQDLILVSRALGLHVLDGHPADVNGDGKVNIQDLVEVAGAIGPEGAAP